MARPVPVTELVATATLAQHRHFAVWLMPRLSERARNLSEESGSLLLLVVLQTKDEREVLSAMAARHAGHVGSHVEATTTTARGRFARLKRRLDGKVRFGAHQSFPFPPALGRL